MRYSLLPSLPAKDWAELETALTALQGVSAAFQVDIVDGVFVPVSSWPFTTTVGFSDFSRLAAFAKLYEFEVDCMVREPRQYFTEFTTLGVARMIIHFGSTTHLVETIAVALEEPSAAGLAVTNDVPFEEYRSFLSAVDFVQVMGIAEVGAQGQPFDERTLATVRQIRDTFPRLEITVDGSVNLETIPPLLAAGANRFAPGSVITKATDPVAAYKQLVALLPS